MISEGLIISYFACAVLSIIGFKYRSLPVIFISSLGVMISGLLTYQETQAVLPLALMLMISFSQFIIIGGKK